ncbi:MAG: hypothetical protein MR372_05000 [Lachnospiraceae bacterium]|nr:hypothetical protein [Lachnospiraceae bacterium]
MKEITTESVNDIEIMYSGYMDRIIKTVKMKEYQKILNEIVDVKNRTREEKGIELYMSLNLWKTKVDEFCKSAVKQIYDNGTVGSLLSATETKAKITITLHEFVPYVIAPEDRGEAYGIVLNMLSKVRDTFFNRKYRTYEALDTASKKIKELKKEKDAESEAERAEKWKKTWEENPEKKAVLEKEKRELLEEKEALNLVFEQMEEEKKKLLENEELNRLRNTVNELLAKKEKLGIFKGKEKKMLQEQINKAEAERNELFREIRYKQEEIEDGRKEEYARMKQIDKRLEKLKKQYI